MVKNIADGAAVDAMRVAFDNVPINGRVVIGEGEMDEAPMLSVLVRGWFQRLEVDIAVDPIEGTNLIAKGVPGSIAVLAVAKRGCLLCSWYVYGQNLCWATCGGKIDINAPIQENLKAVASALDRKIEDMTVVILDVERHSKLIKDVRDAGTKSINQWRWCLPAIDVGIEGTGVHCVSEVGGAPEGVIAATALKRLGGDMQQIISGKWRRSCQSNKRWALLM